MKLLDLRHGIDDFLRHSIRKKLRFRILIQTCNTSASADLRALNVTQLAELDKTSENPGTTCRTEFVEK